MGAQALIRTAGLGVAVAICARLDTGRSIKRKAVVQGKSTQETSSWFQGHLCILGSHAKNMRRTGDFLAEFGNLSELGLQSGSKCDSVLLRHMMSRGVRRCSLREIGGCRLI